MSWCIRDCGRAERVRELNDRSKGSIHLDALKRLYIRTEEERDAWIKRRWWRAICSDEQANEFVARLNEELDALRDAMYG